MRKTLLSILSFLLVASLFAQAQTDELLKEILLKAQTPLAKKVLADPQTYRLQIIYTRIDRDQQNQPHFKNYYFNYDANSYYNPASMVKMPLAFLSLEKMASLKDRGINKFSRMQFDSNFVGQKILTHDSTSEDGYPSIANFIKRAFLISENDPYNRMYQFVGQEAINKQLQGKGYDRLRITRQFMGFTEEQNRHTNPIQFLDREGKQIYQQEGAYNTKPFDFSNRFLIGNGYLNKNDSLVNEPFDFTKHNYVPLEDFQQILQSVLFPNSVPAKKQFHLLKEDREFALQYLSQYPSETSFPKYNDSVFYDSYVKFFFQNPSHQMPKEIRVFNKVGWAYGFLTDVSYVIDTKNKLEYMLSATIYTNQDGILNDDKYEYETVGHPFLYEIGQLIYQSELKRERKFLPNLSSFKIKYNHRNPADKRALITEVDN